MKIPADQVYRTWTGSPVLGAALQICDLTVVILPSWMREDTLGKFEVMNFSKSQMKPITNLCSQSNIAPILSFRYDKWLSFRNEDLHLRVKQFGSLQVVIRLGEWPATGSRMGQAESSVRRCQNCPFDMIYDCHFEMIYDSHFESRAVSIGRKSNRNGSETKA